MGAGRVVKGESERRARVRELPAFVAVLAALSTCPGCRRRITSERETPWADLLKYSGAQNMYRRVDHDGDGVFEYAFPYTLLNTQPDPQGRPIRLIDDAFARASRDTPPAGDIVPRCGYLFVDIVRDAGEGAYYDDEGNFVHGFGICAYPAEYGVPDPYTYIIDHRGEVYLKDTGGRPVAVFPDVEEEGWRRLGG